MTMAQLQHYIQNIFSRSVSRTLEHSTLLRRITSRDEAAVSEILERRNVHHLLNLTDQYGQTVLGAAVSNIRNRTDIITTILDNGAKINKRGTRGETPLFKAVVSGDLDYVRLLLERGADPNKPDTVHKFGPLIMAVRNSRTEIAHELLDYGACICTGALLEAVEQNNHNIFDRLMDAGASPLIRRGTLTTLHLAASIGSDGMLEKLLRYPKMHALIHDEQCYHTPVPHTPLQMVTCRCYARMDVQRSDEDVMEDCCHTRCAQVLLDAGADPNRVAVFEYSALYKACSTPSLPMVRLLIERGAALLSSQPNRGVTNVLSSVTKCKEGDEVVRYIVQVAFHQESESVITSVCKAAFVYAWTRNLYDIIIRILDHKDDVDYWVSTQSGFPGEVCDSNLMLFMLQRGADPNIGLLKNYEAFSKLPVERQIKHHTRYRFAVSPLNKLLNSNAYRNPKERADRLRKINCLLYYGASPKIPSVYYTPLHALMENFGSISEDVIPTVQMMVLSGLNMRDEQWLLDRLQPGVPLGSPQLRDWLIVNVKKPMPLFHRCIIAIRTLLAPRTYALADRLPLPRQLQDYVCLRHVFQPPIVDSNGDIISTDAS